MLKGGLILLGLAAALTVVCGTLDDEVSSLESTSQKFDITKARQIRDTEKTNKNDKKREKKLNNGKRKRNRQRAKKQRERKHDRSKTNGKRKKHRRKTNKKSLRQKRLRKNKIKNTRKETKKQKAKKKSKKTRKNKNMKTYTNTTSSTSSTCNGTSLGDSCLTNLITAMKFHRDKISSFKNQKARAESFQKIIGNKGAKDSTVENTTTYLLYALGGNMTNLNCSGNPSLTNNASQAYKTLINCSTSILASCAVPNNTVNFTLLNACNTTYNKIEKKNEICLQKRTNGTDACQCWKEAASMTSSAKNLATDCDSQGAQKKMKVLKNSCISAFGKCKKAEDSSVAYIMTCSSSSSSSSSSTSSSSNSSSSSTNSSSSLSGRLTRDLSSYMAMLNHEL